MIKIIVILVLSLSLLVAPYEAIGIEEPVHEYLTGHVLVLSTSALKHFGACVQVDRHDEEGYSVTFADIDAEWIDKFGIEFRISIVSETDDLVATYYLKEIEEGETFEVLRPFYLRIGVSSKKNLERYAAGTLYLVDVKG